MTWRIVFIGWLFVCSSALIAQTNAKMTWEEFCEDYFQGKEEGGGDEDNLISLLENITSSPLNLNTASREELLLLPFLGEEQVDSILSFRSRKHDLWSWGDLMMIRGMDYETRRYLSLFAFVGDVPRDKTSFGEMLRKGKHEVESRLDIPFYKRVGYELPTKDEFLQNPNRLYLGNGLANVVRYRYRWKQNVRYGSTFQKDAGEPFGKGKNIPYDYNSAYIYYKPCNERYEIVLGDYELSQGQGLLLGNGFFSGLGLLLDAPRRNNAVFRPHTSGEENMFFRGAALRIFLKRGWRIAAFLSRHKLDALIENDSVRSLQTSGLHRTLAEIERKHSLGSTVTGGRISREKSKWGWGISGYYAHFDLPFSPQPRAYNRYYLRGKVAAGVSLDWFFKMKRWSLRGEGAADRRMHLALTQTFRYDPFQDLDFVLQHRHFSPRFVAPFAKAFERGSRVANEHGLLLGAKYHYKRCSFRTYLDLFYFPTSTYLADGASHGAEFMLQGTYRFSPFCSLLFRYKINSRQRNIVKYDELLEYVSSHRFRLSAILSRPKFQLCASTDLTLAGKQTARNSFGWMASLRGTYKPSGRFSIGAFGGFFFTDDYRSACYAYEPQLLYAYSMPAFFHHGFRLAILTRVRTWNGGTLGLRYGILHYFDQDFISTGAQRINSSTKQDLSLQMVQSF